MNIKMISVVAGVLLLLAIPSFWPYSFYILLRWVISLFSIIVAYNFYQSKLNGWMMVFGGIAFLFNPILPVYLSKSSWILIDFVSACLFFIASSIRKTKT